MKVVIIGAGVVGVTTAYFLAKAGCQVTVLERQSGPALETSFANAGQISPGYASPWAAPGIPLKAMKWLISKHSPLVIRPRVDPAQWRWLLSMLANCTTPAYMRNKTRMVRLAEYSRDVLDTVRVDTGIDYNHRALGTLQLFRSERQLDAVYKDINVLEQFGVRHELLDDYQCMAVEPALVRVAGKFVGGLRLPNDGTGDCHLFTTRLAKQAEDLGVKFKYNADVQWIQHENNRIAAVSTRTDDEVADRYILAAGSYSTRLAGMLDIDLPIYPVKGYSLTVPISDPEGAPRSTVMDETYKVAITRLGDTVRIGGTAELAGYDTRRPAKRMETLLHSFQGLFPDAGTPDRESFWSGFRPMTPDGTPIIGRSRYDNLFLNTGHGTLGWTMACGSAKLIADMVLGEPTDIAAGEFNYPREKQQTVYRDAA